VPDGRALSSPLNGRKGGTPKIGPKGYPGPKRATRARLAAVQKHAEFTAEVVVEQMARGALYDPGDFVDEDGNYKPLHKLTEAQRQCIASVEVVLKNVAAGDGIVDRVLRYKFVDRAKYVEMGARHHALLVDRVDATLNVTAIGARLDAARLKAAKRSTP